MVIQSFRLGAGLAAGFFLAACGSGSDGGGGRSASGTLDTPQAVLKRASMGRLHEIMRTLVVTDGSALRIPVVAKASTSDCNFGGTVDYDDPIAVTVTSPYTSEHTDVATLEHFYDCDSIGPTVYEAQVLDGEILHACPQSVSNDGLQCGTIAQSDGDATIYYVKYGSADTPVSETIRYSDSYGGMLRSQIRHFGSEYHSRRVTDADGIEGQTRIEAAERLNEIASLAVDGTLQRQYAFTSGSADALADTEETVGTADPQTGHVPHQLTYDASESFSADGCELGSYDVHTGSALQFQAYGGLPVSVSAGSIEITQDGDTASVTIHDDGSVSVVDGQSRTTRYDGSQLLAALGDCAAYFTDEAPMLVR
ncbi:hypothetical protein [Solimonas marina]|uniref:YD repeat-containing protein n=1 Tax=Solimonas marina TaxID=2714601 RepID=A0A969W7Q3_9GAMM|nr:hypothetical protein [Solimonas marina]NKF21508.1 hypothetical protein [Solimonas marina]